MPNGESAQSADGSDDTRPRSTLSRTLRGVNWYWLALMLISLGLINFRFRSEPRAGLLTFDWHVHTSLLMALLAAPPFVLGRRSGRDDARRGPARRWAAAWVGLAITAVAVGIVVYSRQAPLAGDILSIELGGAARQADSPLRQYSELGSELQCDFALIVGYGTALWMGCTAATWVFWTPRAAAAARAGLGFSALAVTGDIVENLALGYAFHDTSPSLSLDVAAAAATIKFALVVPAGLVASAGGLVVLWRIASSWRLFDRSAQAWRTVRDEDLMPADLLEQARAPGSPPPPPSGAVDTTRAATPARQARSAAVRAATQDNERPDPDRGRPGHGSQERWRAGFHVPNWERPTDGKQVIGFCLSGGGIRSASFALGFLQTMREKLLAAKYLVSVSGGGYTSGALAMALTPAPDTLPAPPGNETSRQRRTREAAAWEARLAKGTYLPGTPEFDHLRRHASYIAASSAETVRALVVVARGLVASLTVLFLPAIPLGVLTAWAYYLLPVAALPGPKDVPDCLPPDVLRCQTYPGQNEPDVPDGLLQNTPFKVFPPGTQIQVPNPIVIALVTVLGLALTFWLARVTTHLFNTPRARRLDDRFRALAGLLAWAVFTVLVATVGVPGVLWTCAWLEETTHAGTGTGVAGSVGVAVLSYLTSLVTFLYRKREKLAALSETDANGKKKGPVAAVPNGLFQLLLVLITLLALSAAWLLLFGTAALHTVAALVPKDHEGLPGLGLFAATAAVAFALGALFDESSMSLHPFYRRRLASAFATRRTTLDSGAEVAVPYQPWEATTLSRYGKVSEPYPEVIFAAAANLTGEHRTAAGLNAVSFTFNAQWCGGPDIGWVRTETLERVSPSRLRRDLTVQAAVAISGAAVASAMGRGARWYQTLFAVTGARLGAWLPNPAFLQQMHGARQNGRRQDWTLPGLPRIRRLTYLLRELFNLHPASERLLQVTDGGHYENLGLVELLRRRCTEIYCVDGGGDIPPTAEGLANAIALAYTELGVKITLDEPLLAEPGSGTALEPAGPLTALNLSLSRTPIITGTFKYPEASGIGGTTGHLFVARALLWSDPADSTQERLPYDLLTYAARHDVFPHDSTGDQWFDDGQFGAYTALGRAVGERVHDLKPMRNHPFKPSRAR